jgi:hypothetical protein
MAIKCLSFACTVVLAALAVHAADPAGAAIPRSLTGGL